MLHFNKNFKKSDYFVKNVCKSEVLNDIKAETLQTDK